MRLFAIRPWLFNVCLGSRFAAAEVARSSVAHCQSSIFVDPVSVPALADDGVFAYLLLVPRNDGCLPFAEVPS